MPHIRQSEGRSRCETARASGFTHGRPLCGLMLKCFGMYAFVMCREAPSLRG